MRAWVTCMPLHLPRPTGRLGSPSCCPAMSGAEERKRRKRPKAPVTGPSYFERNLDDLIGKRLGRGNIYYGERTGVKTDEELALERYGGEEEETDEYLKDDPVLVIGGTGRTGQWITLGLLNQNFNVRVFTRKFEKAETLFGPSGSNVDVFQGNLSQPATLFDAMDGAVGMVIAAAPEWWRPDGSEAVEGLGTVAAIEAAMKAKTVQRIVLLAPAVGTSARVAHRVEAEEALRASGIPFVIVRIPSLSNKQGGMSNIILRQESKKSSVAPGKSLTRVDAAQIVCQALVHDRFTQEMAESDPEGGFAFGSCVVEASNGDDPSIIDRRYWREQFAALDGE